MTFIDFVFHYFSMPGFLLFLAFSFVVVFVIHFLILAWSAFQVRKSGAHVGGKVIYKEFKGLKEAYYEMVFSATSTLFFTGIYFCIDYGWIPMSASVRTFWDTYNDFLLLVLLVLSIVIINLLDNMLIPLKKLDPEKVGSLRMAGMIFMLLIFAYIKIIYKDDNYDTIVFYFITMLISRFVYLDASFDSFHQACIDFIKVLPLLAIVLGSTGLLAWYGFSTDYLLTTNGVVISLFIAYCFVIVEMFALTVLGGTTGIMRAICMKIFPKKE